MPAHTIHPNGWLSVPVPLHFEQIAQEIRRERDARFGNIFQVESTDQRWTGDLGEMVFKSWLRHNGVEGFQWITDEVSGQPDFILPRGERIDIKTVKRKGAPQPHYTAGMTTKHMLEPLDGFFFMTYELAAKRMWLLGGISREAFAARSRHYKAGESVHENYIIRPGHEINNIAMSALETPKQWLRSLIAN